MLAKNDLLALAIALPIGAFFVLPTAGCSAEPGVTNTGGTAPTGGGASGPGGGGTAGSGAGGEEGVGGFGSIGNGGGGQDACVATEAEATLKKRPVDIVFIIDNSGSMGDNIESVQNNINESFASIIGASGIDYRVIMISEHGKLSAESICVKAPLSATTCEPVPLAPAPNPPIFFQYSVPIGSHNSICQALAGYDGALADQYALGVGGWKQWLRQEALKVFVEVTDDGISCNFGGQNYNDSDNAAGGQAAADKFDAALLALDPEQFGTADARNYIWHSIVGLAKNNPATEAYLPGDALVLGVCNTAVAAGTGYQFLSQKTGGLRFPICEYQSYDVIFQEIAEGVIEGAKVECEFPVPEPPPGEKLDLATVIVEYTPGGVGAKEQFKQVPSADDCEPSSFYIAAGLIQLCPDACAVVQDDDAAKLGILFGCETNPQ